MKKLAIVVGHNQRSQGAVRPDTKESEFVYNSVLARIIVREAELYGIEARIFFRTPEGGYTKEIQRVYAEVDKWGADGAIELHFNAASAAATGTETLTSGSVRSTLLAQEVQMEMVEALGLRNRGIIVRNARTQGRGYLSLVSGSTPTILVEPFFATGAADRVATDDAREKEKLAQAMLEGAQKAFEKF